MSANAMIHRDGDGTHPIQVYEEGYSGRDAMAADVVTAVTRLIKDGMGFNVRCQNIRGHDGRFLLYVASVEEDERWNGS